MNNRLKAAAQVGDINLLYTLIQEDQYVLEGMDVIPFVDTPLHVAASEGHLQFATEIIKLKPSFALKLNQQGFSPIHLAIQQGHRRMVLRFVDINKDLVRVNGREGLTPLHFVSQTGEIDLLAKFLYACPDSIEDLTVRSETALHIAVINQQYEALRVLVGWLKRNSQRGAMHLERNILNWKDEAGNTILHISALLNDSQALQLLIDKNHKISRGWSKTWFTTYLNAKNLENFTALDIASCAEIKCKLVGAGAKFGSSVTDAPTLADKIRSKITVLDRLIIFILRLRGDISEDQRNAFLVVAALIVTATYQTALSPPGGVYQADSGANNASTISLNSTATATQGMAGKSVMSNGDFNIFLFSNTVSLVLSSLIILVLTPSGTVGRLLLSGPMIYFATSFFFSMKVISPLPSPSAFYLGDLNWILFPLSYLLWYVSFCSVTRRFYFGLRSRMVISPSLDGNFKNLTFDPISDIRATYRSKIGTLVHICNLACVCLCIKYLH